MEKLEYDEDSVNHFCRNKFLGSERFNRCRDRNGPNSIAIHGNSSRGALSIPLILLGGRQRVVPSSGGPCSVQQELPSHQILPPRVAVLRPVSPELPRGTKAKEPLSRGDSGPWGLG